MRNDLSDVTVVLDRSGSMSSCRDEAEGGLNAFIEEQKKHVGETVFTLVQFDTEYEFVHKGKPIREVGPCELVPRGMTALLDAVGHIAATGAVSLQQRLFARVEEVARRAGHGPTLDAWGDDLRLMRPREPGSGTAASPSPGR